MNPLFGPKNKGTVKQQEALFIESIKQLDLSAAKAQFQKRKDILSLEAILACQSAIKSMQRKQATCFSKNLDQEQKQEFDVWLDKQALNPEFSITGEWIKNIDEVDEHTVFGKSFGLELLEWRFVDPKNHADNVAWKIRRQNLHEALAFVAYREGNAEKEWPVISKVVNTLNVSFDPFGEQFDPKRPFDFSRTTDSVSEFLKIIGYDISFDFTVSDCVLDYWKGTITYETIQTLLFDSVSTEYACKRAMMNQISPLIQNQFETNIFESCAYEHRYQELVKETHKTKYFSWKICLESAISSFISAYYTKPVWQDPMPVFKQKLLFAIEMQVRYNQSGHKLIFTD